MELQAEHARKQMDAFVRQLEEIRDLATKVIQDSTPAGMPGAGSPAAAPLKFPSPLEGRAGRGVRVA